MIFLFFLLLLLAMAWGLADHFQSLVVTVPPPEHAPIRIEAPAPPPQIITPPSIPNTDASADSPLPDSSSPSDKREPARESDDAATEKN